jgi:hypothetical protein
MVAVSFVRDILFLALLCASFLACCVHPIQVVVVTVPSDACLCHVLMHACCVLVALNV